MECADLCRGVKELRRLPNMPVAVRGRRVRFAKYACEVSGWFAAARQVGDRGFQEEV